MQFFEKETKAESGEEKQIHFSLSLAATAHRLICVPFSVKMNINNKISNFLPSGSQAGAEICYRVIRTKWNAVPTGIFVFIDRTKQTPPDKKVSWSSSLDWPRFISFSRIHFGIERGRELTWTQHRTPRISKRKIGLKARNNKKKTLSMHNGRRMGSWCSIAECRNLFFQFVCDLLLCYNS